MQSLQRYVVWFILCIFGVLVFGLADVYSAQPLERLVPDALVAELEQQAWGIQMRGVQLKGDIVMIDLSQEALALVGTPQLEELMHSIDDAVSSQLAVNGRIGGATVYQLSIAGTPLNQLLPPAITAPSARPAGQRSIALNPGHGWYETSSGGWALQRSFFWGIVEDFINSTLVAELHQLLSGEAEVLTVRELDRAASNHGSGHPWWEMGAREYVRSQGAPETIWNGGSSTLGSDILARPRYATWLGAEVLISVHNNGGGGCGTEIWYDTSNGYGEQSRRLAELLQAHLITDLRSQWSGAWCNRGIKGSNGGYGENREFAGPAVIIELAFMDTQADNAALQDTPFRTIAMTAVADGVREYLGLAPVLNGAVELEQRGSPGTERWIMPLVDASSGGTRGGIAVYAAGTTTLIGRFSSVTDQHGQFSVGLVGVSPGTYDLWIKGLNTLSVRRAGVTLPGEGVLDLGLLPAGDVNGDDRVDDADVTALVPAFLRCRGDSFYEPRADINADGCINGADVSGLALNYLHAGE